MLLLTSVERHGNEQVLAEDAFDYLQVLVGVVGLVYGLLPGYLGWSRHMVNLVVGSEEVGRAVVNPAFLLLRAFLEKRLAQHILLFLMGVVVLDVVVVRLVEHAVGVVVAVRILVPDPSRLDYRGTCT